MKNPLTAKQKQTTNPQRTSSFGGNNTFIQTKSICPCDGCCPRCANNDGQSMYSKKSSCSPDWYGQTEPEIDEKSGRYTGNLIVKYKTVALIDPCVRDCIKQHEAVYVKQLTPVVKKIHQCDVAAGNDSKKLAQCNLLANEEWTRKGRWHRWECEAYRKSFTCLTLKILDSKSPCSRSPHRDEIKKHRGYEACELKRNCTEAGTPKLGIPYT